VIEMNDKTLTVYWLVLITLTLVSAIFADTINPASWVTVFVCMSIMVKGQVIVDVFMGLRTAPKGIRYMMLSYFYVLPPMVALALLFPSTLANITTL